MLDYEQEISKALAGDLTALGALYSETVATVYYSALKITGAPYSAHVVTVRTYVLAFANLSRLAYPAAFPVWLGRLSVYLSYNAAADRYSGQELTEARARLIAFLRYFHSMSDAEIAGLLAMEAQTVTDCAVQPEELNADEFLIGKDAVLGIWHDILYRQISAPAASELTPAPAPAPEAPAEAPVRANTGAAKAEIRKKRRRRLLLRVGAAVLAAAVITVSVVAALHARHPRQSARDREVSALASTLSLQLSGQVGEIYQLDENTYFVSINLGYGSVEGLVIQYEMAENAIRLSSPDSAGTAELSQSELEKVTGDRFMQVLYNPTGAGSGVASAGALDEKDAAPPADAPEDIAPTPAPTKTPVVASEYDSSGYDLLENHGDYSIMLRINCRNVDFTRPMTVVMDSAISKAIGEAGGLQIVLNDARHCITLSTEQLQKLCSAYGSVTLRLHQMEERRYSIAFYSETGKKITELFSTMTFTLPADGPMTYVFALYDGGTESRGGIYDRKNETISFPVYLSGIYELIGSETEIKDEDEMDEETAKAANFLAALKFMPPDSDGCFRPAATMTRNEAVSIIGRMFLATDQSLSSAYPDVDFGDPAYAYITFGTATNILTGVGDGTFRGEADISREELLTICGRTLLYRFRKEASAAVPDSPLGFDDEREIALYARSSIALLMENGILAPGGDLRPKDPATRGEAAVLLYRMYCCLYGYED